MKKLSVAICALFLACSPMMAQSIAKDMRFGAEFGIGSQVELNVRGEHSLGNYLSWDVLALKYAHELNDSDRNELGIKTGLRVYTPFLLFMGLDMGYTGSTSPHSEWANAFGMDLTVGFRFFKNLYMGYGFSLDHYKHGNDKDHTFRIGYLF